MTVSLAKIHDLILPGLRIMAMKDELLRDFVDSSYPHLCKLVGTGILRTVGDLSHIPESFVVGDDLYEQHMVFAGREYPQGWGRGPGGAAAEPLPEFDGKIDTFKMQMNDNMNALKAEILQLTSTL